MALVLLAVFLPGGPGHSRAACAGSMTRPAALQPPSYADDLDCAGLKEGLARSLHVLKSLPGDASYAICGEHYSPAELAKGLEDFAGAIDLCSRPTQLSRFLAENFHVCRAGGGEGEKDLLVTGYFEPLFAGSLEKKPPYLYPLYGKPADLVTITEEGGVKKVGRLKGEELVPYWSRAEIEEKDLLAGREILYLADPVEAFILHVQGSGKVRLPDGSLRDIRYAANNGRAYTSIGRVLVQKGAMSLEEVTLPKIVEYLDAHPEKVEPLLRTNERYVFFSLAPAGRQGGAGPVGSFGQPLTPGRSLALDRDCYPLPLAGYLISERPLFNRDGRVSGWTPLRRLVLNQDTGAAIKGPGRVDLFWGSDTYAGRAAGVMKQPGRLYFFLPKKGRGQDRQ